MMSEPAQRPDIWVVLNEAGELVFYSSSPLTVQPAFTCITCPRCRRTSYNPTDIKQGYCGGCHDWTTPSHE